MIKNNPDSIQRFIFDNADVRGELVTLENSFSEVIANHDYPPLIEELLGQFLAACVLLSATIKFDGRLTLQVRTEGPVSLIMVECTSAQEVRGIVKCDLEDFYKQSQGQMENELNDKVFQMLFGIGTLAITIEPEKGERYQGVVALEGGSLAKCMENYFLQSEQLATSFHFAVNKTSATGLMLQQLPAQLQKDKDERSNFWEEIYIFCTTLSAAELLELGNTELLLRLFHQHAVRLFDAKDVVFQCSCSKERTARALLAIGQDEVNDIIAEQNELNMDCEFCGAHYIFSQQDIDLLFESGNVRELH